jgi:hypothetical protein
LLQAAKEVVWAREAELMAALAGLVIASALSVAESVDDLVACFRSGVKEKSDICPVHDKLCSPDLQVCSAGGTLPIHRGDDVGLL